MKAIILAAGYATRLYPLTKNKAKPLLELGSKPIINYILEQINLIKQIDEVLVITNNKFYDSFKEWLKTINSEKVVTIVNDGTMSNDDRLGAVGDLIFLINKFRIKDDLLVIAGDNLFGFPLESFIEFFHHKRKTAVAVHDLMEVEKVKGKYGVVMLNHGKIVDFQEKPISPRSTVVSTGAYIFPRQVLGKLREYAREGGLDNSGDLIKKIMSHDQVYGYMFSEFWFDIGSPETLAEADQLFSKPQTNFTE